LGFNGDNELHSIKTGNPCVACFILNFCHDLEKCKYYFYKKGEISVPGRYSNESVFDMFIFEASQLIGQLEEIIIKNEKENFFDEQSINEIFRITRTIKGSSAMMSFSTISSLAHSIEDLFYCLREDKPQNIDCSVLCDLVLGGVDFIKTEIEKIKNGGNSDGDAHPLIEANKDYLSCLKQNNSSSDTTEMDLSAAPDAQQIYLNQNEPVSCSSNEFKAVIHFDEGCEMENIRAYNIIYNLKDIAREFHYIPQNIMDGSSIKTIQNSGFTIYLKTDRSYEEIHQFLTQTAFIKSIELEQFDNNDQPGQFDSNACVQDSKKQIMNGKKQEELHAVSVQQSVISVNVAKLDKLMDLVGEMVIAEAMVIQNPDLKGLELENFQKSARQLNKITNELQDAVMSIRMVPLSATFHKMHRIIRDMCKKLDKDVGLQIIGEETEVDKNIIEHISDPLMHLIRNSIDHGIESPEERQANGKPLSGMITIEAKNAGSDVLIIVRDDGRGLNKRKILEKAKSKGLLHVSESDMTDREIYKFILLPGFSTNDSITEYSGRGVGMDVVTKNIEEVGGSVSVNSSEGAGTTVIMKIPLTLAIIYGMNISVGNSRYTIPTTSIKESFRPKNSDIIRDPDNNEMIMVRGRCYPLLRLHRFFGVKTDVIQFTDGILVMAEQDDKTVCIFADELLGQQQVVVKSLPIYIRNKIKIGGLAGCTLLGDGSISLILDIPGLADLGARN
jgi:two-component system chemotaxis sensor kinase CheA